MYFLVVGVPGLCFLIAGGLSAEYPAAAVGGALFIGSVYELSRKRVPTVWARDQQRQRLSFVLAGVIGMSLAVTGFFGHGYWQAAAGTVLLIGALLRLQKDGLASR